METSKEGTPKCPRGRVGCPKERRERERKRGPGELPIGHVGYWLDSLGILGEVSLNRHED